VIRILLALAVTVLLAAPASAERLVSAVSNPQVLITSSFDGATLSLFGSVEPDEAGGEASGPYHVVVVITGPLQDRVARIKTSSFGIWSNTDFVNFRHFPSFYAVISSGSLDTIADPAVLTAYTVLPEDQARATAQATGLKAERFSLELVRLMKEEQHFVARDDGVRFLSNNAYVVNLPLPSDVANGPFLVRTLVFKEKVLVAERTESFSVRKSGFENYVFVASRQQPLLYGLVCVMLALGTGWLAGVAFKR
jgi:uncharacterized protein (TIGR02186 family)